MRSCGPCTLCCTLMGVDELDKPAAQKCAHDCGKGCRIYDDRPTSCREFSCLWLLGSFPSYARPDKVGFVGSIERDRPGIVHIARAKKSWSADRIAKFVVGAGWKGAVEMVEKQNA